MTFHSLTSHDAKLKRFSTDSAPWVDRGYVSQTPFCHSEASHYLRMHLHIFHIHF